MLAGPGAGGRLDMVAVVLLVVVVADANFASQAEVGRVFTRVGELASV